MEKALPPERVLDCRQSLASAIRSCRDLSQARELHARVAAGDHLDGTFFGNLLIEMYGKCGHPECSRQVFECLRLTNEYSWNLMIAAFAHNGFLREAQHLFYRMAPPSLVAANVMIAAYARYGHAQEAKKVFDAMLEHSTASWISMLSALIHVGHLEQAREMLDTLPVRDVACSNLMISAYANSGQLEQAKRLFDLSTGRDVVSWNCLLDAYAAAGKAIESQRLFEQMPCWSAASVTIVVSAMARVGRIDAARAIFESAVPPHFHDALSWTALLAAVALHGGGIEESEDLFFHQMPLHTHVSWAVMLTAYARHSDLYHRARELFQWEMPQHSTAACNSVMSMCVQAGDLGHARKIFEAMEEHDVESWNLLLRAQLQERAAEVESLFAQMPEHTVLSWTFRIAAAAKGGGGLEFALSMLDTMPRALLHDHGLEAWTMLVEWLAEHGLIDAAKFVFDTCLPVHDRVLSTVMLLAYGRSGRTAHAKQIFHALPERDLHSWNALLSLEPGDAALKTFRTMPERDVVSWTSAVSCCAGADAIHLFRCANLEGERINRVTLVAAIDACSGAGAVSDGQSIHSEYAHKRRKGAGDARVENALLSMYGSCGCLAQAMALFEEMKGRRDLVSWNAIITAYAHSRDSHKTLPAFWQMNNEGMAPDAITFTALLCACSRLGWLQTAPTLYHSMIADFSIAALARHLVCMVDLLGRMGRIEDAEAAINATSARQCTAAWRTLLAASELHGSLGTGARAATHAASSPSYPSPPFVVLSNLLIKASYLREAYS